jgi:uroporphyrinogen-III decarboxylase
VEKVARWCIDVAAEGGDFSFGWETSVVGILHILAAAHNIQDDTPPQNVVAMFEAAKRYGKYPILIK